MKFASIAELEGRYPVKHLCQVLHVSKRGYYAWRKRAVSARHHADLQLGKPIEQIYQTSHRTYGSPRIHAELPANGMQCGCRRVMRLMRQRGLSVVRERRRSRTTDSQHSNPVAPNRLAHQFSASRPNEKWVGI